MARVERSIVVMLVAPTFDRPTVALRVIGSIFVPPVRIMSAMKYLPDFMAATNSEREYGVCSVVRILLIALDRLVPA